MTLIVIDTHRTRARIMSDTWGYTIDCAMSATSKQTPLPHLGAAIVAQGSTGFQARVVAAAMVAATQTPTFDAFLDQAPSMLRDTWDAMTRDVEHENSSHGSTVEAAKSVIFLVGPSGQRSHYVAHAYASENAFKPIDLTGQPYAQPTPLNARPGVIEAARLRRHFEVNDLPADALVALGRRPALSLANDRRAWVDLAKRVRTDRAECDLFTGFKTYVGGDVHLTTLAPGSIETRTVHRFADDTDSLRRVFAGSLHIIAQLAPCASCGSSQPYVDCCLGSWLNGHPCPCDSGVNFDHCCSSRAANTSEPQTSTGLRSRPRG